jgi:hypothetical protein
MASKVEISNMALGRIGVTSQIANIDTEKSNEAKACRTFFDAAAAFVLRDFDWNFARRYAPLALIAGDLPVHMQSVWTYRYALPADCLAVRKLVVPTTRLPRKSERIPYEIMNDYINGNDQLVLYTDQIGAVARYTKSISNPALFDPMFVSGLSWYLGSEIAPPLSVKEDIAKAAREGYMAVISRAWSVQLNEEEEGDEPESDTITYRNS